MLTIRSRRETRMDGGGGHKSGRWGFLHFFFMLKLHHSTKDFMQTHFYTEEKLHILEVSCLPFLISQPNFQTESRHDKISDDKIWAAPENRRPRFHHEAGVWRSGVLKCTVFWLCFAQTCPVHDCNLDAFDDASVSSRIRSLCSDHWFGTNSPISVKLLEILMTPSTQAVLEFPIAAQ